MCANGFYLSACEEQERVNEWNRKEEEEAFRLRLSQRARSKRETTSTVLSVHQNAITFGFFFSSLALFIRFLLSVSSRFVYNLFGYAQKSTAQNANEKKTNAQKYLDFNQTTESNRQGVRGRERQIRRQRDEDRGVKSERPRKKKSTKRQCEPWRK